MPASTSVHTRIAFLGAGRMAGALAGGLLRAGVVVAADVIASDPELTSRNTFHAATGSEVTADNLVAIQQAGVIFLAVKPQIISSVLAEIRSNAPSDALVISIAAGITLSRLEQGLPPEMRVVRVMPNTPALVGKGAAAFSLGRHATAADAERVQKFFATVGTARQVPESLLDAVTGLSGSGPAYAYQIIEALSDGGVKMGLPRAIATELAAQTLLGAAAMVLETGKHPGALKDEVTSPGGTTIAGLHALELGGLRAALIDAVEAATLRSRELRQSE